MNEWIASYTALPNLHPALVHFPIALVPLAALLDLLAAAWSKGRGWLGRAGALVWALAGIAAGATYWAGRQAADSLVDVDPQVLARIGTHSDWALYTLWAVGLLAVARLAVVRWKADHAGIVALAGILGLGVTGLLFRTADLGGALVYQHAVAVAVPDPEPTETEPTPEDSGTPGEEIGSPEKRFRQTADGRVEWRPLAGDAGALGKILEPLSGRDAVTVTSPRELSAGGLGLELSGRVLLALPEIHGDVQVDAEIDPSGFRGTVGLAHHIQSADRAGLLRADLSGGELALLTLRSGAEPEVLASAEPELPSGPLELGVYAAGRHLRGLLDGETVVHGHAPALPDGRVGLFFDGEGRVMVRSVTVTPIDH